MTAGVRCARGCRGRTTPHMARAAFDLAIVSVLLDAGAGRVLALRGGPDRRDLRPLGGARRRELRHVHRRHLFEPPRRPLPGRCGGADGADPPRNSPQASRSVRTTRSSASRAALPSSIGSAASSPTNPETFGREDDPRPGGLFDVLAAGRQRRQDRGDRDPRGAACPSRPDLAGPHRARRRRSRRHLAPSARRRARRHDGVSCPSTSCRSGSPIR